MTDIEKGSRPGWPDAEWVGKDCPECGAPFVARDKHGLYCCVCTWNKELGGPLKAEQCGRWP